MNKNSIETPGEDCYDLFIKYFEGYKYHEIAKELKIPIATVKAKIKCARIELKNNLKTFESNFLKSL